MLLLPLTVFSILLMATCTLNSRKGKVVILPLASTTLHWGVNFVKRS